MKSLFMQSAALISDDGRYRYWLTRTWDERLPVVCWCMLNPSTADHAADDPTIRRVISLSTAWSFGACHVVNLYALRSTNPNGLHDVDDPVGPDNDLYIEAGARGRRIIAAWGCGDRLKRAPAVLVLLRRLGPVECLEVTTYGHPKHPLYVKGDTQPIPFGGYES